MWVIGAKKGWKGKPLEWVEKASFEKIRRLLEVSEWERHYKVLLTSKNLADVRCNSSCYNLPIIPRPMPSKVVAGKHFVIVDLLRLISRDASASGGVEAEIADRRSVARSPLGPSASNSGGSGSAYLTPRWNKGGSPPERLSLPSRGGTSAPRVLKIKKKKAAGRVNAPGTQVRDFIPWVRLESSQPLYSEEEEEEEMTRSLDCYAARKRKRQEDAARGADVAPS